MFRRFKGCFCRELKNSFAPFIMQKIKLSTLQEQKRFLKNIQMKTKSLFLTLLLHVKYANYVLSYGKHVYIVILRYPPNIQDYGLLDGDSIKWVGKVFPEGYHDCLNMDTEDIAAGSDTKTDSESDDDFLIDKSKQLERQVKFT